MQYICLLIFKHKLVFTDYNTAANDAGGSSVNKVPIMQSEAWL